MYFSNLYSHFGMSLLALSLGCSSVTANQATSGSTKTKVPQIDTVIIKNLGAELAHGISGAKSVSVAKAGSRSDAPDAIQGLMRDGESVMLSTRQAGTLKRLMLTPKTHVFGARARCRYRPKYIVTFKGAEKSHSILLSSPKCPKWSFKAHPKRKILDIRKPNGNAIVALVKSALAGGKK